MQTKFGDILSNSFYPSAYPAGGVLSSPMSSCLSVRPSVCLLPEACPHDNSKGISHKFTKLANKMYLSKLTFPIVS